MWNKTKVDAVPLQNSLWKRTSNKLYKTTDTTASYMHSPSTLHTTVYTVMHIHIFLDYKKSITLDETIHYKIITKYVLKKPSCFFFWTCLYFLINRHESCRRDFLLWLELWNIGGCDWDRWLGQRIAENSWESHVWCVFNNWQTLKHNWNSRRKGRGKCQRSLFPRSNRHDSSDKYYWELLLFKCDIKSL